MDVRHEDQQKIVELYKTRAPLKSTLVLSTGFGKSKVAIDIIRHENPTRIILLVNSTILRDYNWEIEFKKFNAMDLFAITEIVTYQAAYKWKASEVDLTGAFIVADEIDFAGDTDQLAKFFYEYPYNKTLGLTGYIAQNKKEWFAKYMPILTQITASQAQSKGLLNNIHFVFVKYDLSDNPNDVVIEYKKSGKKKSFTQSENNAYDYQQKQIQRILIEMSEVRQQAKTGEIDIEEYNKQINKLEWSMKSAAKKRGDLLLNSKSTQRIARKLLEYNLKKDPENKVIVFSKRTAQSGAICGASNVYNGYVHKDQAKKNFEDFKSGVLRHLGVCEKVNRGANIPNLNICIMETFYGSDTQVAQRFGRMMRLRPDQTATAFILLPYYMREDKKRRNESDESFNNRPKFSVQETQQVTWANDMLRNTDIKSYAIWDYRVVKKNIN